MSSRAPRRMIRDQSFSSSQFPSFLPCLPVRDVVRRQTRQTRQVQWVGVTQWRAGTTSRTFLAVILGKEPGSKGDVYRSEILACLKIEDLLSILS